MIRRKMAAAGRRVVSAVAAVLAGLSVVPAIATAAPVDDPSFRALVFSKTAGFRHDAIPDGIAAIQKLGQEHNFTVDSTEDATAFTDANLARYQVVIFLSTTGDVLDDTQQASFERYVRAGGGYAGVHAASDTEYGWAWYGSLVGAYFKQHPAPQQATVKVEDPAHPSTQGLPTLWSRTDEWYDYQTNPRSKVHVLAELDEKSYTGGTMGSDHPITWCQDYDGGRSWYTGLGHTKESYTEPNFLHQLLGGIQTAAGVIPADCSASQDKSFEKVTLDDNTSNPMMLDIAPDGRVFYIDRLGDVKAIRPTGGVTTAAHLNVFTSNESGLLGIALDPAFATNSQVYLYFSPTGKDVDRLSRFTVKPDSTLDLASEKVVLEVPVQRAECCHHGGGMVFDKQTGDLWLANGDNTNPFASDGYTPIDERPGRSAWDAQGTSANTNDLRGKVLRIRPQPDGTYTIPAGNLFPQGTANTRPEIYAMGMRNPFRIGIDPKTHKLMVANYGPDAGTASATRGPENTVEWDVLNQPGNYGWPYCVGNNRAYNDYNFATNTSGALFNCANPVNNSPNNTGLTNLPLALPAMVYYHAATEPAFPELGGGGAPMAGPVYRYDPTLASGRKWPAYWDGKAIFGEWNQNKLYSFQLGEDGSRLTDINQILSSFGFKKPMDMKFGQDGALYLIEWGSGFGGDNTDSGIYRIDYVQGNRAPIARATADRTSGPAPLTVRFSSEGSRDPDGTPVTFAWDFQGDGATDSTAANPTFTYQSNGNFSATLTVSDAGGRTSTANVPIVVGNSAPTVTLNVPPNGGFFDWGDQVRFGITVSDPEDGTITCTDVKLQSILGHDSHGHPLEQYTGCSGAVQTTLSSGHSDSDNVFAVLEASYTDKGGAGGAAPLTGRAEALLQPKHKQAEFFTATGRTAGTGTGDPGVQVETTSDTAGGFRNIGSIEDGDWWSFNPTNLSNVDSIRFRVASGSSGGVIEVHAGAADGPLVGSVPAPVTAGWQVFTDVTLQLSNPPATTGPLYFVARKPAGSTNNGGLFNVNWVDFIGKGVTDNQRPSVTATGSPTRGTAPLTVNFQAAATDPEGDLPLTYQWDFGVAGAPKPATPDATYIYTAPGTYQASVTVTDSRGAAKTERVPVIVDSPPVTCLSGRSDSFDGQLDRAKWTVIRENQDLAVSGGSLRIPTANADIYGSGNTTPVPNIVVQPAPAGAWQATTKVSLAARDAYQQAGLVLYGDDDNYAKMVLEGRGTADANARIFQYIREENGAPNEVTASNTPNLGAAYPDTVYVRLASDGTRLTASYSADGLSWTQMPETGKLIAGINNPRIGLMSLSSTGNRPVVEAAFDWFQMVPDDTATAPTPNDEFAGTSLDACRWGTIVRHDPTAMRVAGGNLELDTTTGDIYGTSNTGPKNFILQTPPSGDWTVETKVDASALNEQYQQAGLIAYLDDANYVKFDFVADNTAGSAVSRRIELRSEVGDVIQDPQPQVGSLTQGVWWLRLVKQGNTYRGLYSADGTAWTDLGQAVTNAAVASGKVGLFTLSGNQTASKTAKFDYFHASWAQPSDKDAPVTTAVTDPAGEWAAAPVKVTLSATDSGSGVDRTEYTVDGGAWTPYTVPFTVSGDGTHQVGYRSADKAGNVETTKSLTVKVDTTAPTATAATTPAAPDGQNGWFTSSVSVAVTAADATSGLAKTEVSVDNGPWAAYTEPVSVAADGSHTVAYRVTDVAGNTFSGSLPVNKDATAPLTSAQFAAPNDDGWHNGAIPVALSSVDPASGVASTQYSLDGGPWKPYTEPVNVTGDGTHTVAYRSTDRAGNVEQQKAATVKIDGTKPTVLISGIADGQIYGDSQDLRISWQAVDPTSGIKTVSGALDSRPYTSGSLQALYELGLGIHSLSVTAVDKAGNQTVQTVTFGVTTSTRDVGNLVDRFRAVGWLSQASANKLQTQLTKVRKAEAAGNDAKTVKELQAFRKLTTSQQTVPNAEVRQILTRDTDALIARLSVRIK
ncbi:PKD repeat protein/glucose/arabinose dehydrogenase [Kibdelosporangium banguiense]|uniref:PKD repeat protein/glucose/arabinose dehydrogenase n=1 Tax=Kibdelosporangium banguiense TaxID=1365924 RepID=A0ABS4TL12_9PSEU|nr:ThuA domain-containing protein [Kibdelosporangium banguiense]MBP2325019.1 PKD repeat protein/glucose/arabinose dehydrogenase [Kibdelosporangium banguiense]